MILLSLQGYNNRNDMANKKANQPQTVGIPIDNNPLARNYKREYKKWLSDFRKTPYFPVIEDTLFQRKVRKNAFIPYLELCSSFHKRTQPDHKLILFVSCNPSGREEAYYGQRNLTQDDFCYYDQADSIYNQIEDFVSVLGLTGVDFAMADVFPIVRSDQDVLKKAWKNKKVDLLPLTSLFKNVVCEIQPTVIVSINAFVTSLFGEGKLSNNTPTPVSIKGDLYYKLSYDKGFETVAFCGGMLTGKHAMDKHSKLRLIHDVHEYLISHP